MIVAATRLAIIVLVATWRLILVLPTRGSWRL
jgi:hypothetical protein